MAGHCGDKAGDGPVRQKAQARTGRRRVAVALAAMPGTASAQLIGQYFQTGVPGFGEERGVPVLSRARPEYASSGVTIDGVTIRADLDETVGYNSNVQGVAGGPGSWIIGTAPSVQANIDGPRGAAGLALTLDDQRFLDTPGQDRTDWTAALGVTYELGPGALTVGYAHLDEHEVATAIGTQPSTTAIPFQVDDVRAGYSVDLGRFTLTPNLDYQRFRFGMGTVLGAPLDESVFDRDVLTAGVTARLRVDESRGVLLVVQGVDTSYLRSAAGQPSSSSQSVIMLAGVDYQSNGVFRYRLLAGFERRSFEAAQFPTTTTPVAEASVIWLPTGLTTVTASLSRTIADATTADSGGYTYTTAGLVIDHELRRNVLLQGRSQFQLAEYTQGGTQDSMTFGAGVTWLLSPRVRVSGDYDFTHQGGVHGAVSAAPVGAAGTVSQRYDQSLLIFRVHLAL